MVVRSPYVLDHAWELKEQPVYTSPLSDVVVHVHGESSLQRMGIVTQPQEGFGGAPAGREKARWSQGIAQELYRANRF